MIDNSDEVRKAELAYESALKKVRAAPTVAEGAIAAETKYAEAYQGLVKAGVAPQIKTKHRFTGVKHQRRAGN